MLASSTGGTRSIGSRAGKSDGGSPSCYRHAGGRRRFGRRCSGPLVHPQILPHRVSTNAVRAPFRLQLGELGRTKNTTRRSRGPTMEEKRENPAGRTGAWVGTVASFRRLGGPSTLALGPNGLEIENFPGPRVTGLHHARHLIGAAASGDRLVPSRHCAPSSPRRGADFAESICRGREGGAPI